MHEADVVFTGGRVVTMAGDDAEAVVPACASGSGPARRSSTSPGGC